MSERPDDDRRQALDQRLASLRKLQLAARIVAVVAALITLGWLVLGISSLSGDLGMAFAKVDDQALAAAAVEIVVEWNATLPDLWS